MTEAQILETAKTLLRNFEGYEEKAYPDGNGYSVGYGTNTATKPQIGAGFVIDKATAEKWLDEVVKDIYYTTVKPLGVTGNRASSLISFIYNIGKSAFKGSTMYKLLRANDYVNSALQFDRWIYEGNKINQVLVKRRKKEKEIFMADTAQKKSKWIAYILFGLALVLGIFAYTKRKAYGSKAKTKTYSIIGAVLSAVVAFGMLYNEKIKAIFAKTETGTK